MGRFDSLKSNNPFRHAGSSSGAAAADVEDVAPPPGPPPSYHAATNDDFAPPPGPPPSHQQQQQQQPPPPQHDWQSVPLPDDTSSYPPPPDIFTGHDRSWANNATEAQAEEGERWCARYPLLRPLPASSVHPSRPRLLAPNANTFAGAAAPLAPGVFSLRTTPRSGDSCATVQPACYLAARDDPRAASRRGGGGAAAATKTVYFEVRILADVSDPDVGSVAVGFAALPYPPFRMPGWHRGSLAVHSDDGRRYVNDRWGGVDFVAPWGARGTVVGVGMRFSCPPGEGAEGGGGIDVECFFTRGGRLEGSWDVNGERDAQRDLEPLGVQGFHDLVAVVGTFQRTEVEIVLDPGRWMYRGAKV